MFEAARSLILKDRSKARKALADEIKQNENDELDAELDQLEREENERLAVEQAEAARALRAADARKEILQIQAKQHEAAKAFDVALASANAAFERLEQLATDTAKLERELGGDGKPSSTSLVALASLLMTLPKLWLIVYRPSTLDLRTDFKGTASPLKSGNSKSPRSNAMSLRTATMKHLFRCCATTEDESTTWKKNLYPVSSIVFLITVKVLPPS